MPVESPTNPQILRTVIINGMCKFAGFGSILMIAHYIAPGLYHSLWPMFYTDAYLTIVGLIADLTVLPRLGQAKSLLFGFFGVWFIIWATGFFWPMTHMTLADAAVLALCMCPLEYALHRFVVQPYNRVE